MNPTISAADLGAVPPIDVQTYLRSAGWVESDMYGSKAQWWRKIDERTGQEFEVLVPLTVLRDYSDRIRDLLERVALSEGREPEAVFEDLRGAVVDELKIRIESSDLGHDLPLVSGATAFSGVRDLMICAAGTVSEPRRYYTQNQKQALKKMLSKVRLGQTRPGSFVINVLSERLSGVQKPLFAAATLEHQIFAALSTSLVAVRQAGLDATSSAFDAAVGKGVSANLCYAVARFGKITGLRGLTFAFRWSRLYADEPLPPTSVTFSPQLIERVREGGETLAESTTRKNFTLIGTVEIMQHQENEAGTVTVLGLVDDRRRPVTIFLRKEDHVRAIEAYRTKQLVSVLGDLERHGERYALTTARDFALMVPQR